MSQLADRYTRRYTGLGDAFTDHWGAARAAAAGVAHQHVEYPAGVAGVKRSLTEMARLMREARLDPAIGGYCADVLKAAGIDGRNRSGWTARAVTQALLDNVRQVTIYAPDAVAAEVITSPAGQLCLRPGLCIRKEDCDGLTTLLGAMVMSVGFRAFIVKQSWGPSAQEHVLLAVEDEDGNKLLADPSHASLPVGRGVQAHSQEIYDPLDADCAVNVGAGNAELVTFGALPPDSLGAHGGSHGHGGGGAQRPMHGGDGSMRRYENGRWVSWNGMSWVPSANVGCLQWGAPLAQPSARLIAYANSVGAANMPIISTIDGAQYLFAIKNGRLVIRPCTGTVGVGAATVNDQLAPRPNGMGAAVGLGITTLLDVKTQSASTSSLMDATNAGMQSCAAVQPADLAAWNVKYAAWKAWYGDLQTCISASAGDMSTAPPDLSCLLEFGYQWGSNVPDILRGYNVDAQGYIAKIKAACPSQPLPVVPSGPVPPPPGTPGAPGVDKWVADAETIGKVVVGTLGISVLAYATYKVVQLGAGIAGKAAV